MPGKRYFFVFYRVGFFMTASALPQLCAAGESHVGCVRRCNEDNFCYISRYPGYLLAVVADGVGGHVGGEIASYLGCHRLMLDWKRFFGSNQTPLNSQLAKWLDESIQRANLDIFAANFDHKNKVPMCTTLAAAVFTPDMVIVAHVGDSRVYCCRGGKCWQLTVDHTLKNDLYEQGAHDAGKLYGTHIISRAVGAGTHLKVEMHSYFRQGNERYLLCTDGLVNCWNDREICQVLSSAAVPRNANDQFIRGTLRKGAADNVTVLSVFPEKNS